MGAAFLDGLLTTGCRLSARLIVLASHALRP
jgi:hypothetical protein